jgi:hypothetical protein
MTGVAGTRVASINVATQTLCCNPGPAGFIHRERPHAAAPSAATCHTALTAYEVSNKKALI